EHAELAVQLDAVAAEPHHRRGRVELRDQACRVAGRAARELALVEQQGVFQAGLGKVVGDAGAGDAAADHDRLGSLRHRADYREWRRPKLGKNPGMKTESIAPTTGMGAVDLAVTDGDRALRFYRDYVGLTPLPSPDG